jgi:integrase
MLWTACVQLGQPFGPLFLLLLLTGQRRDEVASMNWSEVNIEEKVWVIPKVRTKNGREHIVPLSQPAIKILGELPIIGTKHGYVFTTNGTRPVSGFSKAKKSVDVLLGASNEYPIRPWRLHDLRRTAASGMARAGHAIHVIEAVLNHRSGTISGVAAVYNRHHYLEEKRSALQDWATMVSLMSARASTG